MNSQKNFESLLKKEIIVADGKTVMMFTFTGLQIQNQGILFRLNCSHANLIITFRLRKALFQYILMTIFPVYLPFC